MAFVYTDGVNPAKPAGSDPANVDDDIRAFKLAINERLDNLFGFVISIDDPLLPTKFGTAAVVSAAQIRAATTDNGSLGAIPTINFATGNIQRGLLTANTTLAFTNPQAWTSYLLYLKQNGTGGYTITFPSTVRWTNNASAPTLVTTANRVTVVSLVYDGSVYLASIQGTGYNVS